MGFFTLVASLGAVAVEAPGTALLTLFAFALVEGISGAWVACRAVLVQSEWRVACLTGLSLIALHTFTTARETLRTGDREEGGDGAGDTLAPLVHHEGRGAVLSAYEG